MDTYAHASAPRCARAKLSTWGHLSHGQAPAGGRVLTSDEKVSRRTAPRLGALATALALVGAGGCALVAGLEDHQALPPDAGAAPGKATCAIRSDCPQGEACLFGYCSVECRAETDCPEGERCLTTKLGAACVGDT